MQRISRMATAAVAMVMLVVCSTRAAVLDQVPGDALFVVKVTNLKGTSDKLARFCADLGIGQMIPPLGDPLGFAQAQLGITAGIDTAGDMALAFIDPAATGGDPEKSIVVLIPVSNYGEFVNNEPFKTGTTADGVTEWTGPDGQPSYIAQWGNYAAVTPAKEVIGLKPSGLKVAGVSAKELNKDIVFYAPMGTIRGKLQPLLAEGRTSILKEMEDGLKNEAPEVAKFAPVLKAVVGRLLDVADSFLRDCDAATIAVNFVPEGLNASVVAEFQQGSYIGNFVSSTKNTADSFTKGLPEGKYVIYGGSIGDPAATSKLVADVVEPIMAELKQVGGPQAEAIDKVYQDLMTMVKSMNAQAFGLFAPQGEVGSAALIQSIQVYKGDAPAIKQAYFGLMENQDDLMAAFNLPQGQVKYNITKGGKTIGDTSFDQIVADMKFDGNSPDAAQVEQMMKLMYGPDGLKVYLAEIDAKTVLQVSGVPDETTAAAITALRGGADPIAAWAHVKKVNANIPQQKAAVFYVAVDELGNSLINIAKQFGAGVNVQLPPDLPPLVGSVATEGTALRIDGHASSELIQQIVAAGMQAYFQAQQGGGQKRGPGGL